MNFNDKNKKNMNGCCKDCGSCEPKMGGKCACESRKEGQRDQSRGDQSRGDQSRGQNGGKQGHNGHHNNGNQGHKNGYKK